MAMVLNTVIIKGTPSLRYLNESCAFGIVCSTSGGQTRDKRDKRNLNACECANDQTQINAIKHKSRNKGKVTNRVKIVLWEIKDSVRKRP
jgi:hypothetical protein